MKLKEVALRATQPRYRIIDIISEDSEYLDQTRELGKVVSSYKNMVQKFGDPILLDQNHPTSRVVWYLEIRYQVVESLDDAQTTIDDYDIAYATIMDWRDPEDITNVRLWRVFGRDPEAVDVVQQVISE